MIHPDQRFVRTCLLAVAGALVLSVPGIAMATAQWPGPGSVEAVFTAKNRILADAMVPGLAYALVSPDTESALGVLRGLDADADVRTATLVDAAGKVIAAIDRRSITPVEAATAGESASTVVVKVPGPPSGQATLMVRFSHAAIDAALWRSTLWAGLAGFCAALALAGLMTLAVYRAWRPMRSFLAVTRRLAAGDLDVPVPDVSRRDKLGALARAVQTLRDFTQSIVAAVEQQAEAAAEIATGVASASAVTHSAAADMKLLDAAVGETDQSAAQVNQAAMDAAEQVRHRHASVDVFLSRVSAA